MRKLGNKEKVVGFFLPVYAFSFPLKAQDIQKDEAKDYQFAYQLYTNGLFEEANKKFEAFIQQYPSHELIPSADYYFARSKTGADSVNIEAYYDTYIRKYPNTEYAGLLLQDIGHRFIQQRKYDEAISYYRKSLESGISEEKAGEAFYWMAEAAVEKGENERARQLYLELADTYPDSEWAPEALFTRGQLYLLENAYDESTEAFELLRSRYPSDPITRRVGTALGESYYQRGRYEEAITALQNAIPTLDDESRSKAVLLIAESYNYLDNYERASTRYLQYINLNKGTDKERNAHYGLGWLYHKQQIYHWAADAFEKAAVGDSELARKALYYKAVNEKLGSLYAKSVETFEEFGERYTSGLWVDEAYYEWAISAFEGSQYGETIEVLQKLIRNQEDLKNPGQVYTLLGEAYYANGEFTRAVQAFEEAEKTANIDPAIKRQAQFQKAWVLFRNQAYEQAQPIFEQVYNEAPGADLGEEALFWSADSYYQQGQYGKASNQFAEFVRQFPSNELIGAARYSLGWAYFIMGDYERATPPLEAFLEDYNPPPIALFPYDTDTRLRTGDAYYALGNYTKAIEFYNKAIGAEPGGDYAMFQVGNSFYRANNTYRAVDTFRRLLRIYPFSRLREQAQYNIAYIYLNTSNYSQAVTEFQTVIEKYPNTSWAARAQYNIGDAYYNAGEYDRAVQEYKKVLDEYPRSSYIIEAINGIQYAQLSSTGQDSSSQILEDFLGDNPRSSTADQLRYRQAENVFQTGDYESAIREFRQYLRVTNSDRLVPDTYANLAESYLQTGQTDRAIEALQTIVDEFTSDDQAAPALTSLGRIYFEGSEYTLSHDVFEQLLRDKPRFRQEAYIGMGNASVALNNLDAAKNEFDAAISINPSNDAAKIGLGKVAFGSGNYAEAQRLFSQVASSNTTGLGAEAQYNLGKLQHDQGEFANAIEEYAKVKVLYEAFDEWVSVALYGTAECQIRLGNQGEALNTLNSIIQTYPGTDSAIKAQALVDTLN